MFKLPSKGNKNPANTTSVVSRFAFSLWSLWQLILCSPCRKYFLAMLHRHGTAWGVTGKTRDTSILLHSLVMSQSQRSYSYRLDGCHNRGASTVRESTSVCTVTVHCNDVIWTKNLTTWIMILEYNKQQNVYWTHLEKTYSHKTTKTCGP